jgi:Zn-finger nucleic acid-binding protein
VKGATCPGCSATMEQRFFDRKPSGKVELDICFACHAIWFDQYESVALTPGAVLELFRVIHKRHDEPLRPLGDVLKCPACRACLALTHDLQRSTRISYYRCPKAHGRLTTFFQFLREKQFVRELTGAEIAQLRASVKQIRCSSCGAPVDLARNAACGYCRAPVSILDADAVAKTLAELDAQERGRKLGDPQEVVNALLEGRRPGLGGPVDPDAALAAVLANGKGKARTGRSATPTRRTTGSTWSDGARGEGFLDLVSDALDFLGD